MVPCEGMRLVKALLVKTVCLIAAAGACGGALSGCHDGVMMGTASDPTPEELIRYYSPQSLKVLPFTKPRSFDEDAFPDGVGVSVRTQDGAGDPVKAYGTFLFELYAYKSGLASHRGELLNTWQQAVRNPNDQKTYWERVTSTYEFQLSWEGKPVPPQERYILVAYFQSPGSKRLTDEYAFEFRATRDEILNARTNPQP